MSVGEGTRLPLGAALRTGQRISISAVLVATAAMLLVGIVLRWAMLDRVSLWYDEGFTWWVATQTPSRIIEIIRADTWPPLYYLLMHYWIELFGDGVFAMRAQPALASSVALLLAILLSRAVFAEPAPRVISAGLLALSAVQISYAPDVRCYPTATLALLVGMLAIVKRLQCGGRSWLALYIASATALVYLHNVMWFYLACLNLAWLLWPGKAPMTRRVRDLAFANVAVVVLFAPWLPSLIAQVRTVNGNFWIDRPTMYEFTIVVSSSAGLHTDALREAARQIGIADTDRLIRWPAFALLLAGTFAAVTLTNGDIRRRVLALLCVALGPIVLAYFYSQLGRSIFIERVFLPSSVFLAIGLAAITAAATRRRAIGLVLVSIVLLTATSSATLLWRPHEEPWRQAMAHLQSIAQPGDRVLFFAAEGELMYRYYARQLQWPPLPTGGIPRDFLATEPPRVQMAVRTPEDLQHLRRQLAEPSISRVLVVDSHAGGLDPKGLVQQMLQEEWRPTKVYEGEPIAIWACER